MSHQVVACRKIGRSGRSLPPFRTNHDHQHHHAHTCLVFFCLFPFPSILVIVKTAAIVGARHAGAAAFVLDSCFFFGHQS